MAAELVYSVLTPTLQYCWPLLCERTGAEVWLKHENHTPIGSFKMRGGLVLLNDLKESGSCAAGVIAATRGNHGQSIGFAARRLGLRAVVVAPHGNSPEKNAAMRALGVELIAHGEDFQASLEYAAAIADQGQLHLIPSFHPLLVRGVATYCLEMLSAASDLDTVYVPIGLGSGICGMIAARDALGLKTKVVGVVSDSAPAYALSFNQRRPISQPVTTQIADGIACRTPDEQALDVIWNSAERIETVTDDQVRAAMRYLLTDTHNVAEGAGASALAALLNEKEAMAGKKIGLVLTGANVDRRIYAKVLAG